MRTKMYFYLAATLGGFMFGWIIAGYCDTKPGNPTTTQLETLSKSVATQPAGPLATATFDELTDAVAQRCNNMILYADGNIEGKSRSLWRAKGEMPYLYSMIQWRLLPEIKVEYARRKSER